jgi:hypothetical protein
MFSSSVEAKNIMTKSFKLAGIHQKIKAWNQLAGPLETAYGPTGVRGPEVDKL